MPSDGSQLQWGPVKKGFRRPLPQWYLSDDVLYDTVDSEIVVNYLQEMFKVLTTEKNTSRWEEYGICDDVIYPLKLHLDNRNLKGIERLDFIRRAVLDDITWRIAKILRYTYPLRLREALEPLEVCWETTQWFNLPKVLEETYDPILRIYLATAREQKGGDFDYDMETVRMLRPEIIYDNKVGPRNFVLALCTLARLYRRLGRAQEAHEMVKALAQKVTMLKYSLTPFEYLQNMDTETRSRMNAYLGYDPFEGIVNLRREVAFDPRINGFYQTGMDPSMGFGGTNTKFDGHPLPDIPFETDKRALESQTKMRECWVSGCRAQDELKRCSSCGTSVYCSRNHPKEAWPRHKQFCGRYKEEKESLRLAETAKKNSPTSTGNHRDL